VRCSGLDVGWRRVLSQRGLGRQVCGIDLGPCVDHRNDLDRGKVGEGEVMRRGEGQDVTLAGNGLGLEETRFEIYMRLVHCCAGRKRVEKSVSIVPYHLRLLHHRQPALPLQHCSR
jgi:hypothetical protein